MYPYSTSELGFVLGVRLGLELGLADSESDSDSIQKLTESTALILTTYARAIVPNDRYTFVLQKIISVYGKRQEIIDLIYTFTIVKNMGIK